MRILIYSLITVLFISCKNEETVQTVLVINNNAQMDAKLVFFQSSMAANSEFRPGNTLLTAFEGDTVFLNSDSHTEIIWAYGHQQPTTVLSEVVDSINIIRVGIDSIFEEGVFMGFEVDSVKYKKDQVINASLNVFNDANSWEKGVKNDSWSASFNSHEEVVHVYTFNVPDLSGNEAEVQR